MVDPWQRSKRLSSGKSGKKSRPRNRGFYLDENYDCPEVKDALDGIGVSYRVYSQDVKPNSGIQDEDIFPHVGTKIFITGDADQRRKERIRYEIKRLRIRAFVLPSNLSKIGKAQLLKKAKNKIMTFCGIHDGPFVANIDKQGKIELRMDKDGKVYGRKERK
jgi:hypothetical protein